MACRRHLEFWSVNLWDGKQLCTGEVVSICKRKKLELYPHQSLSIYFSFLILLIVNSVYCELHITDLLLAFLQQSANGSLFLMFCSFILSSSFIFLNSPLLPFNVTTWLYLLYNMLTFALPITHHSHMWFFHQLIH